MPNQRSKNKVYLGGFVEKQLHTKVIRMAKKEGFEKNKFGFAALLMSEGLERRLKRKAA
jgi:hypothetical protein